MKHKKILQTLKPWKTNYQPGGSKDSNNKDDTFQSFIDKRKHVPNIPVRNKFDPLSENDKDNEDDADSQTSNNDENQQERTKKKDHHLLQYMVRIIVTRSL